MLNLEQLGLVAGTIDDLGIVKIIDHKLGAEQLEKISAGQTIKAPMANLS
jgi:hypothetical protein